ncbi:hypothetical protein [Propionivibrio sp.]|uniref:hypothetical protein n=1 Tax=Propionivibrio sp. TaxID=2212460 RepID=UPI003BEF7889
MFSRQILQRYMPGERALQVINDEGFYFRRIDGYPEDPTEGDRGFYGQTEQQIFDALISKFSTGSRITPGEARELSCDAMYREKQSLFIQSWYWHEQMSLYMWEHYGKFTNSPDCVLLTVNYLKLGAFLDKVLPVGCRSRPIEYVQDKQVQRDAVYTKRNKFEPERELRVSINVGHLIYFNNRILPELNWPARHIEVHGKENLDQYYHNDGVACEDIFKYVDEYGFLLKAPLPELLEAIYVPSSASAEFSERLDELLALKGYAIRCCRIKLPADQLGSTELENTTDGGALTC